MRLNNNERYFVKFLVAYDSDYGNTAKVAEAISVALKAYGDSTAKQISKIKTNDLKNISLLVLGSPTQGGQATKPTQQFIDELTAETLSDLNLAVFDTRFEINEQVLPLRLLMKTIGYAAPKMAKAVQKKGGQLISEPKGFIVTGREGPLKDTELASAKSWATTLAQNAR